MNAKNGAGRKKPYKDLIEVTENTIGYAEKGLHSLKLYQAGTLEEWAVVASVTEKLKHYLPLARQVVCQARRGRVCTGSGKDRIDF